MFSNAWVCLQLSQWHFPSKNHFLTKKGDAKTGFLATEESTQIRFLLKLTTHFDFIDSCLVDHQISRLPSMTR